jgi:UPF0755 protein
LSIGAALCWCWIAPLRLAQYVHAPMAVDAARVEIPRGAGPLAVARALNGAGLASWVVGTRWGFRLWGRPAALKAGAYTLSGAVRLRDVFADLEAGRVDLVRVTLPEGLTGREMGLALERAGVTTAEDFAAVAYDPASPERWGLSGPSLEGYLFPDTYRFARGLDPEQVVEAMVRRFRAITDPLLAEAGRQNLDLRQWVILASIVEKEAGNEQEKPVIAAVFLNRLARGDMRLESDPTVIYGLAEFDGNLRREDLRRDTPYNTYTRKGLPPGSISNPGQASLEAVIRPAQVPYLYFVSRNDGTHAFSSTYRQHVRAVDRYQRKIRR